MSEAGLSRWRTAAQAGRGVGPVAGRESERDDFYEHLLHVCLLLLLQESPGTGADLRDRLRPLGFEQTAAAVHAALDALSGAGLVLPPGVGVGAAGPASYALTADGSAWLRAATQDLRRTEAVLGGFLARCGERLMPLS